MLGAVKGGGAAEGIPLFRILARRWKSLAPVKRERTALATMSSTGEQPKAARVWISKPRQIYVHQKIERPKLARSWNPWLWVK
jgi:hypothetical protein